MASIAVPVSSRFLKLSIDNFYQISRKTVLRTQQSQSLLINQCKKYGTVTEEKKVDTPDASPSDLSEAEKKLKCEIEDLNKELISLKERNGDLEDKYKRALADGQNTRLRLTDAITDAKIYGIQGFCKDLLGVADILGKATESVPKDELNERNPHLKSLYEGLRLTESELLKAFKKHGLVSMNPLDEKFDPEQHESLFHQKVEGKEPGTIVVVSKLGYKLHERVVRPALVVIAAK